MSPSQLEFFPFLAVAYAVSLYAVTLVFAAILLRLGSFKEALTLSPSRYGSIDGLRGILAVGVFVHHSFTAYGYFAHGRWAWSSSAVFNQLGQTTVALFFMISGFLFTIKAMSPKVDWKALYTSRIARLFPLYIIIVCIVFLAIFILSGGVIRESARDIAREFGLWLCFARPNINAYPKSWTLIAGVNWSLAYEALFYLFGVPLLHLVSRLISVHAAFLVTSGMVFVSLALGWYDTGVGVSIIHFLGGILTAYAFTIPGIRELMQKTQFKYLAAIAACSLLFMQYAFNVAAILSTITLFAAIVGGASVFGILKSRAAIWLGDVSYGIYLIHGMVLWVTLANLRTMLDLNQIDLFLYFPIVILVSGVIVTLASLSYIKIEKPAMAFFTGKGRRAGN